MAKDKIELHITATRNDWGSTPIRIRTVHRGKNGKVRASKTTITESYVSSDIKRKKLDKALKTFIDMFNLFTEEVI